MQFSGDVCIWANYSRIGRLTTDTQSNKTNQLYTLKHSKIYLFRCNPRMICIYITFWRILFANFRTKDTFIFIVNSQEPGWNPGEGAEDFDPSVLLPAVHLEAESERHDWRQRRGPVQHPRFTRKPHLVFNWGKNKSEKTMVLFAYFFTKGLLMLYFV